MKQILIKYAKWWYALSAALGIATAVLACLGKYEDLSGWMFAAGVMLALFIADATGQLKPFRKRKD